MKKNSRKNSDDARAAKQIRFLDLTAQYPLIRDAIEERFAHIVDTASFVSGDQVEQFEKQFAGYCGADYCVAVNNGTSALYLSLLAMGIGPGDEVIVPVNTFIATAEAVTLVGATPVFVDCDMHYLLDVHAIRAKLTSRTRAVIPVHLYGQCVDMDPLRALADEHGFKVLEDACQAHGAEYRGRRAGSMGTCGAFSFYPGKNLGTWGEGGAVVTDDADLAQRIRLLRSHGSAVKYHHDIVGGNFRMTELEAAVLNVKLPFLDAWNERRRAHAKKYAELLAPLRGITLPKTLDGNIPVWHLFVVRTPHRDAFLSHLKANGVQTGIHYPVPLHLTPAYAYLSYHEGDFPVAERMCSEIVSLPMYPELPDSDVAYVAEHVRAFAAL